MLPPSVSPSRLMRHGLAALGTLVSCDAAWWGESSGGIDGLAPRNWLSGRVNLGADFAREWNAHRIFNRPLDSPGRTWAGSRCRPGWLGTGDCAVGS